MVQWWECYLPPGGTSVILTHSNPVCCCFLSCSEGRFLWVLQFYSLLKNQNSKVQFDQDREPARNQTGADMANSLKILYHNLLFSALNTMPLFHLSQTKATNLGPHYICHQWTLVGIYRCKIGCHRHRCLHWDCRMKRKGFHIRLEEVINTKMHAFRTFNNARGQ